MKAEVTGITPFKPVLELCVTLFDDSGKEYTLRAPVSKDDLDVENIKAIEFQFITEGYKAVRANKGQVEES